MGPFLFVRVRLHFWLQETMIVAEDPPNDTPASVSEKSGLNRRLDWGRLAAFSQFFSHHFARDNCMFAAGALSFTSLLSLVPLMAVTFSVLAAFPVFQTVTTDLQAFVFKNFVPAAGEVVSEHLNQFAQKASGLTAAGIVFLLITALMLMGNIDRALNAIWKVQKKRSFTSSFLIYWAILTLGPLLVGAGLVMTSYLVSAPLFNEAADTVGGKARLLSLVPYLTETLAFALLYMLVPNRPVRRRHAFAGGLLAAVLFETAKHTFAWYVTQFPTYEAIYGALAAMPIFLVWIFLSWLVILIGAEFTYALGHFRHVRHLAHDDVQDPDRFIPALRVLRALWLAAKSGESREIETLTDTVCCSLDADLQSILEELETAQWVQKNQQGAWLLCRDMGTVDLLALYRLVSTGLPDAQTLEQGDGLERALFPVVGEHEKALEEAMQERLADFFQRCQSGLREETALIENEAV